MLGSFIRDCTDLACCRAVWLACLGVDLEMGVADVDARAKVFVRMDVMDWDDAFDNSGYVAGAKDLPQHWATVALAQREALTAARRAALDVPYGSRDREVMDVFQPEGTPKGTVIFVHGGYWRMFDKSSWSHLSAGPLAHGWSVAMPSYPLAPAAQISQITRAIIRAVVHVAQTTTGPIALIGHSAGGHLVSRMICADVLPDEITRRVSGVVSVSGVHHLDPLVGTKMNDDLRLTAEEAAAESPVHLDPVQGVPLSCVVGDHERPEFLRQTRMLEERWAAKGVDVRSHYAPGLNHFNVIDSLADPAGLLTTEVLRPAAL